MQGNEVITWLYQAVHRMKNQGKTPTRIVMGVEAKRSILVSLPPSIVCGYVAAKGDRLLGLPVVIDWENPDHVEVGAVVP